MGPSSSFRPSVSYFEFVVHFESELGFYVLGHMILSYFSGVAMELEDSLYPLLREVSIGIDPYDVFQDVEWALLIGAKPRGPGMERAGLLDINGQIFAEQVS